MVDFIPGTAACPGGGGLAALSFPFTGLQGDEEAQEKMPWTKPGPKL